MNEDLHAMAKQSGDELIDMSFKLADKLDTWSNIAAGNEGTLKNTDRAGFVNKTSADEGIDMVIDVQAPEDSNEAVLRTWAIESDSVAGDTKLFNNIQLTFAADYSKTRSLTERFDTVLKSIVVSNQSGFDDAVQGTIGTRYDLNVDEIEEQGSADEVCRNLREVLETLQLAAD